MAAEGRVLARPVRWLAVLLPRQIVEGLPQQAFTKRRPLAGAGRDDRFCLFTSGPGHYSQILLPVTLVE